MSHHFLMLIAYLLITFDIAAQSGDIHGVVFDNSTQYPLSAASVYYKDGTAGTITNNEGEFTLERVENKTIVISYLGYETLEYNQNSLPKFIYLIPSSIQLPELIVLSIDEKKLINDIWKKYYQIYETEKNSIKNTPFTFFYRQITRSDSTYSEFIECFFTGTNTYGVDNFNLQKGRYAKVDLSPGFSFTFTNFFQLLQVRPFHQSLPPRNVFNTFIQPNFDKLFDVKVEKITNSTTSGDVITLEFTPKRDIKEKNIFPGKLHVLLDDNSIVRFEGIIPDIGKGNPNIKKSNLFFTINYKKGVKRYPIVETVKCTADFDILYDDIIHTAKIDAILFDCSYRFSDKTGRKLTHNDFLLESIEKTPDSQEFWVNNPIVKRTSKEEFIVKTFISKKVFGNFKIE